MIAPSVVQEVRRLLAEGDLSQRKIAGIAGISRGTVGAIAAGKRPDYESLPRVAKDEFPQPAGPPQRCPGCGGMVYVPCRLCHTRALEAGSSKPPIPAWPAQRQEPLGLDLRGEDRARYEEVRLQKVNDVTLETDCEAERTGEDLRSERGDLCGVFEGEDDQWELDPADFGEISRADLWDAFELDDDELDDDEPDDDEPDDDELDDDEPEIDHASVPDLATLREK